MQHAGLRNRFMCCLAVCASVLRLIAALRAIFAAAAAVQSLSYRAVSMSDVTQGNVSGGVLHTLSKPVNRLSRLPTPAVRRDKDA
jgi:chorismate mutase